jgi:hypothetical protein
MFERFYKLSALGRAEDPAALQDFDPADVSYGSFTTDAVEATRACMSAVARKRTSSRPSRYVRFVPILLQKSIFADDQNSAGRRRDFRVQDVRDLTASRKIHRRPR